MGSPLFSDYYAGLNDVSVAARLIRRTGAVMNDPALTAEAERLRTLVLGARTDFARWWRGGAQLLMADPLDPVLLPYIAYYTLAPVARAEAARAAVTAFCFNTREILFGPDPRRRDLLTQVAAVLKRVPKMDDMVLAERRELEGWISDPSRTNRRYADLLSELHMWQGPLTVALAPLARIGMGGLKDRMLFCFMNSRNLGGLVQ